MPKMKFFHLHFNCAEKTLTEYENKEMIAHFHSIKSEFVRPPVNSLSSFDFMTAGSVGVKCDSFLLILDN